ncbi:MAG: hypothetical protein ACREDR_01710 [Blastocatellia bacterium]
MKNTKHGEGQAAMKRRFTTYNESATLLFRTWTEAVMAASLDDILRAAQSLPMDQRRELAARLTAEVEAAERQAQNLQTNLAIVRQTHGTIKGLDRETVIALAEDEEYCGY